MATLTINNALVDYNFNVLADWSTAVVRDVLVPYTHPKLNFDTSPHNIIDAASFAYWVQ